MVWNDLPALIQSGSELKFPLLPFVLQVADLAIETLDVLVCSVNGSSELSPFLLPATDSLSFFLASAELGLDLIACLAFAADGIGGHDEFHAAGLARSILSVAVLAEVAPLPVVALEHMLIEETHGVWWWSRLTNCGPGSYDVVSASGPIADFFRRLTETTLMETGRKGFAGQEEEGELSDKRVKEC